MCSGPTGAEVPAGKNRASVSEPSDSPQLSGRHASKSRFSSVFTVELKCAASSLTKAASNWWEPLGAAMSRPAIALFPSRVVDHREEDRGRIRTARLEKLPHLRLFTAVHAQAAQNFGHRAPGAGRSVYQPVDNSAALGIVDDFQRCLGVRRAGTVPNQEEPRNQ